MPKVGEIEEADYQLWKHHPVSKLYFQYLENYRDALMRELLARWESGALLSQDEQEIRGRVMTLRELSELDFASIQIFYQTEEDNAAQDSAAAT